MLWIYNEPWIVNCIYYYSKLYWFKLLDFEQIHSSWCQNKVKDEPELFHIGNFSTLLCQTYNKPSNPNFSSSVFVMFSRDFLKSHVLVFAIKFFLSFTYLLFTSQLLSFETLHHLIVMGSRAAPLLCLLFLFWSWLHLEWLISHLDHRSKWYWTALFTPTLLCFLKYSNLYCVRHSLVTAPVHVC